jgi:hypothetical protein
MKHARLLLLVLFGMAAFPQPASANAGTAQGVMSIFWVTLLPET